MTTTAAVSKKLIGSQVGGAMEGVNGRFAMLGKRESLSGLNHGTMVLNQLGGCGAGLIGLPPGFPMNSQDLRSKHRNSLEPNFVNTNNGLTRNVFSFTSLNAGTGNT
jgi:hypothetical protein